MKKSSNGYKRAIYFDKPPERIVSLIPSLTESIIELGLGDVLVGVTDYCVYPPDKISELPKVGGTKSPDVDKIMELEPELVLVNQEENTEKVVSQLETRGINVWVTFPKTVREALDVLWTIVGLFQSKTAAIRLEVLETSVDWAESSLGDNPKLDYFCPIWLGMTESGEEWWMTFNRNTYIHDLLRLCGGNNVFADRERVYPIQADLRLENPKKRGKRDTRYPRVSIDEIHDRNPQLIFLPSEPFHFREEHKLKIQEQLRGIDAVQTGNVYLVDGSLLTWHGTRLARALQELPVYFA